MQLLLKARAYPREVLRISTHIRTTTGEDSLQRSVEVHEILLATDVGREESISTREFLRKVTIGNIQEEIKEGEIMVIPVMNMKIAKKDTQK